MLFSIARSEIIQALDRLKAGTSLDLTTVQPIVVDVENREDIIPGDFVKFATCCKWKGLFVEADLIGSLIESAYTSDRQFHEAKIRPREHSL
jgi:hypothetical protein